MKNETIIFCDGASKGNPGPGGWGAVVIQNNFGTRGARVTELGGREEHTTNNRMELTAAIKALALVSQSADILVKTDSKYFTVIIENEISQKKNLGGGYGLKMLNDANQFPNEIFKFEEPKKTKDNKFYQEIKIRII